LVPAADALELSTRGLSVEGGLISSNIV